MYLKSELESEILKFFKPISNLGIFSEYVGIEKSRISRLYI